jgi:hypothetical protein
MVAPRIVCHHPPMNTTTIEDTEAGELRRLAAGMRAARADFGDMLDRLSGHPVELIELDVILRSAESALRFLRIESGFVDRPAPV